MNKSKNSWFDRSMLKLIFSRRSTNQRSPFSGPNKGDAFRKKPTKEANWKDLLRDIEEFKYGFGGKLKKIKTDDRSKPMLAKTKKGDKVCYIPVPAEAKFFNN